MDATKTRTPFHEMLKGAKKKNRRKVPWTDDTIRHFKKYQGRQFESQLFKCLPDICGAKVSHTTSYHPQCNGKVYRFHRTLKGAIKAYDNIRWTKTLPTVLLGLRAAIRPDTNHSIAQMVYCTSC
ncbi:hypothetical protein AVEN_86727-1 [Araneus ventricosus]|uniref:Integrase catalytic domain-containing protein n=1 Tax=Araneus ventricosus TaxID=182803 RepID=A0A4Y2HII7_ARAVE|nr:hypothetical protein AVEN_86727-1 [Araneus ventricosus]